MFKEAFEDAVTYVTSTIVADCQELAETLAAVREQASSEDEDEKDEGDEQKEVTAEADAAKSSPDAEAVTEGLEKLKVAESATTSDHAS